jgi:hypothetical protein
MRILIMALLLSSCGHDPRQQWNDRNIVNVLIREGVIDP